jgi:hypothetical protein
MGKDGKIHVIDQRGVAHVQMFFTEGTQGRLIYGLSLAWPSGLAFLGYANAFQVFVQSTRHQLAYRAVPVAQAGVAIWNISDTS